jgi:hypothetical protein
MVSNDIISIHCFLLYVVWHVFACHCPWHIAAAVEVCAEVVHLSIDGGGAPFSMDCPLYNRKLQVVAIKDTLAAKRLSLLGINGSIPTTDDKGYTVQTYEPGSTVNITAEPRAGVCGSRGWRVRAGDLCQPGPSIIGIAHNAAAYGALLLRQLLHDSIPYNSAIAEPCSTVRKQTMLGVATHLFHKMYNARRSTCLS